jgi:hypothetical protein
MEFSKLERLFHILWKQKDALEGKVFEKQETLIRLFDDDGSQPYKKVVYEHTELSLEFAIRQYEQKKQVPHLGELLPSDTDLILLRHAHQDLYDLLETKLAKTPHKMARDLDDEGKFVGPRMIPGVREKRDKALIISGHPGIPSIVGVSATIVAEISDDTTTSRTRLLFGLYTQLCNY